MTSNSIEMLDFETSTFKLINEETERGRSIGTRENVFVHEQAPDEVFILPWLSGPSNTQKAEHRVVKHVIDLLAECSEIAYAYMFGHFKAGDLVIFTLRNRNVSIVHAKDTALRFRDTSFNEACITPCGLVTAK